MADGDPQRIGASVLGRSAMAFADYPVQSLMYITNRPELVFTEGKGSWLTDHNGKRYLDFVQGWAVNCLGHSNQGMADAVIAQAAS